MALQLGLNPKMSFPDHLWRHLPILFNTLLVAFIGFIAENTTGFGLDSEDYSHLNKGISVPFDVRTLNKLYLFFPLTLFILGHEV